MTNPRDHWPELRSGLSSLLSSLAGSLDGKTVELVKDFVENREFGVALEWLHSAVLDRQIQLSDLQTQQFKNLAELMRLDLEADKHEGP